MKRDSLHVFRTLSGIRPALPSLQEALSGVTEHERRMMTEAADPKWKRDRSGVMSVHREEWAITGEYAVGEVNEEYSRGGWSWRALPLDTNMWGSRFRLVEGFVKTKEEAMEKAEKVARDLGKEIAALLAKG
jgi:hypothetical protein